MAATLAKDKAIAVPVLKRKFQRLKERWLKDTAHLSDPVEKSVHPAYQRIIGMGPQALPLIFAEMRIESGHWFWALSAITGANPIEPEIRGKMAAMTKVGLRWAEKHGY